MNDRIRTAADDALHLHKELADLALEGTRNVQKQVVSSFDAVRASMELGRDMQHKIATAWLDAVVPAKAEAKSA